MENSKSQLSPYSLWRGLGVLSAIVLGVGAVLPWGHIYSEAIIGLDGDGLIILIIAVLVLILLLIRRVPIWISLLLGLIAGLIGVIGFVEVGKVTNQIIGARIGSGLYITIIGSIGIVVTSAMDISKSSKKIEQLED